MKKILFIFLISINAFALDGSCYFALEVYLDKELFYSDFVEAHLSYSLEGKDLHLSLTVRDDYYKEPIETRIDFITVSGWYFVRRSFWEAEYDEEAKQYYKTLRVNPDSKYFDIGVHFEDSFYSRMASQYCGL